MNKSELPSIDKSRHLILEAVGSSSDVALVLGGRLMPDELAAAGARELLRDKPYREVNLDALSAARGETAVLVGGNFAGAGHDVMPRVLAIAERRFERVIVLPCLFDAAADGVRRALSDTRATVFASAPDSYLNIMDLCEADVAHDTSFFFDFTPYAQTGSGVLNAFGDDISVTSGDLEAWLRSIAVHEVVRTDVVRVMIAAALMGKRVEYALGHDPGIDSIARWAFGPESVTRITAEALDRALGPLALQPTAETIRAELTAVAQSTPAPQAAASPVRVTAVLLTRDRPELLLRALESIEQSQASVKTLVIDNGSSPRSARAVAAICDTRKDTELRRSDRNLGCAGGRRLGADLADTEFVLFLDDDAELMPGALDHLLYEVDRDPHTLAVTATVVQADGTVLHSGGTMQTTDDIVTFTLMCSGVPFAEADLPASGPSGWVPGGASLTRRELFREFSLDPVMSPYFEDNEWCYRVSKARPDCFRRSREALVLHLAQPKNWGASDFASRSQTVDLLASFARFYQVHGRLLGPWLFHHAQQLCADDGSCDLSAARILMELVAAKGSDWTLMAWMNGDLDSLLTAHSRGVRLENTVEQLENTVEQLENTVEQRENTVEQLENTVEQLEKTVEQLEKTVEQRENTVEQLRAHTDQVEARLKRVEGSVTWQLFQHVRARTFALLGGERSRAVRLFQWVLRLLGRALRREPEDG